jgi:very-short-patch-repair endonuclease
MLGKVNTGQWPKSNRDLADFLGTSRERIQNIKNDFADDFIEGEDFIWSSKQGSPALIKWNETGAIKIARHLRSEKAAIFLEEKGIKSEQKIREEHYYIDIIRAAIRNFTSYKKSFPIDRYRIDLYLPELKIAIECDEWGHKTGYNKWHENYREDHIKSKLKCKFIRFNPHDKYFNIGDTINEIFSHIINKRNK